MFVNTLSEIADFDAAAVGWNPDNTVRLFELGTPILGLMGEEATHVATSAYVGSMGDELVVAACTADGRPACAFPGIASPPITVVAGQPDPIEVLTGLGLQIV